MKTKPLSPTQVKMLTDAAASPSRTVVAPGGYVSAGPDASRFWRTFRILAQRGLMRRHGWQAAEITDAGIATLKELTSKA